MGRRWRNLAAVALWLVCVTACAGIPAQREDGASGTPAVYSTATGTAAFFACSNRAPERVRATKAPQCDDTVYWDYALAASRASDPALFEKTIVAELTEHQNMGGARFRFPVGHRKDRVPRVFPYRQPRLPRRAGEGTKRPERRQPLPGRVAVPPRARRTGGAAFESFGGRSYLQILNYTYRLKRQTKEALFQRVAEIVRLIEAAPGDVMIHCFGGMHRTGVVFGVMQKCLNRVPIEQVLDEYRCHTDWKSAERPGGASQDNEMALREFPCELLSGK